jgi:Icc protein
MTYRVIQITDSHLFADKKRVVGEEDLGHGVVSFDTLASVLAEIPKHQPDLVLVTGDLSADESAQSYLHFNQLWCDAKIDVPVRVIPGNHDDAVLMKQHCAMSFWEDEVINASNWRLHCLHSQLPGQKKGNVNTKQLEQLQSDIDMSPHSHHFIAVHHHPIAMNSWMDNHHWINKQSFVDFVEKNRTVKVVIHGHVHTTRNIPIKHARLLATPSTCWQFKHEPEFAFDTGLPAFRIIDLHQDGSFDTCITYVELHHE